MSRLKLLASLLLICCTATVHAADDAAAQLSALYVEFWEENLKLNPVSATFAGDPRYNGELPNFLAPEYEKKTRDFEQKYLDRARAIGTKSLTGQDRLSYDIFTLNRESALEDLKFPERLHARRPVQKLRQLLRAVRLRHQRAAVRDREGLRRLAQACGSNPGDFRPVHREHA